MHLCGSTGWVEIVLVRLSWMTASRHGVVAHHRYEYASPANRGQPLQKVMAGCPNYSGLFIIGKSIIVIRVEGQAMRS